MLKFLVQVKKLEITVSVLIHENSKQQTDVKQTQTKKDVELSTSTNAQTK